MGILMSYCDNVVGGQPSGSSGHRIQARNQQDDRETQATLLAWCCKLACCYMYGSLHRRLDRVQNWCKSFTDVRLHVTLIVVF